MFSHFNEKIVKFQEHPFLASFAKKINYRIDRARKSSESFREIGNVTRSIIVPNDKISFSRGKRNTIEWKSSRTRSEDEHKWKVIMTGDF